MLTCKTSFNIPDFFKNHSGKYEVHAYGDQSIYTRIHMECIIICFLTKIRLPIKISFQTRGPWSTLLTWKTVPK